MYIYIERERYGERDMNNNDNNNNDTTVIIIHDIITIITIMTTRHTEDTSTFLTARPRSLPKARQCKPTPGEQ